VANGKDRDMVASAMALAVREYANVDDLPRDTWDGLVRECRASIFFDSHLLAGIFHHGVEHPLAIRYFAVMDGDELVGAAVAYALRRSVWWSYYEVLLDCPDLFRGPWIAMPSVLTWSGDAPLRAGSDAAAVAALLVAHGRAFARDQGAVALVATDVTRDAPLTAPLRALADLAILLDNNAVISVRGSFEAYVASLESGVRRELMRVRRRAEERGCRWSWYRPDEYPPGVLDQLLGLTNGVSVRHDHEPAYSLPLLTALATAPSARLVMATAEGDPVAGFLVHEDAATLYVQAGGWDAERKELSPFVNLIYEVVYQAHAWRKQAIEFGRTNYRFKRKHGCHFLPLYGLFYLTELADAGLRDRILTLERGLRDLIGKDGGETAPLP
jgi:predicted N-acyltransferase